MTDTMTQFEDLLGKVLTGVERRKDYEDNDELVFTLQNGEKHKLYHQQECCEYVSIEDIVGDLNDLVGSPILLAEVVTSNSHPPDKSYQSDSFTWTFYKLATIKGYVTIRWYGSSNGYYSEYVEWM